MDVSNDEAVAVAASALVKSDSCQDFKLSSKDYNRYFTDVAEIRARKNYLRVEIVPESDVIVGSLVMGQWNTTEKGQWYTAVVTEIATGSDSTQAGTTVGSSLKVPPSYTLCYLPTGRQRGVPSERIGARPLEPPQKIRKVDAEPDSEAPAIAALAVVVEEVVVAVDGDGANASLPHRASARGTSEA